MCMFYIGMFGLFVSYFVLCFLFPTNFTHKGLLGSCSWVNHLFKRIKVLQWIVDNDSYIGCIFTPNYKTFKIVH